MKYWKAFFGFLLTFVVIDSLWIGFVVRKMYHEEVPQLLSTSPDMVAGVLFYLVYSAATTYLIMPAMKSGRPSAIVFTGAVVGLITYGTFSFTNKAVLVGWTYSLVVPDMMWGVFITGLCAWFGSIAYRHGE